MNIQTAVDRLNTLLPLKERQERLAPQVKQLHQLILRSLANRGVAPTEDEITEVVGKTTVAAALQVLSAFDLVVLNPQNPQGSTVLGAYPLTTELTPHRLTIGSHSLYAMCALDAVSVAPMFSLQVKIDSRCHVSGQSVHIRIHNTHVLESSPQQVMVGIRWQTPFGVAAHSMCTEMVFLKDKQTALQWQSRDEERISLFSRTNAIEFGAAFFLPLLS